MCNRRRNTLVETVPLCSTSRKRYAWAERARTAGVPERFAQEAYFNPECECFVTLLLNTRRRVKGHCLISIGTLDTVLVHPRDVFRPAVIAAAAVIVLVHNHPSGESQPSDADIRVTRDLVRAGQLLKIEVLDHVIIGRGEYNSLRELGWLSS